MGIVPVYVWNHLLSADNRDGLVARSEQPVLPEEMEKRKMQFRRLQEQDPYLLERLVRLVRIFKAVYCPASLRHIESATLICEFFKCLHRFRIVWTPSTMGTSRANRYRT